MLNISKIKNLYKSKGLTQKELAEKIGYSETGLIKGFKEQSLKMRSIINMAEVLDVDVSEIYSAEHDIKFNLKKSHNSVNEDQPNYHTLSNAIIEQHKKQCETYERLITDLEKQIDILHQIIKEKL